MSAGTGKYEALYLSDPNVCGAPFPEFVAFAERCDGGGRSVLDLGCGQGRDAFIFARRGFGVVGVDISPTGVTQITQHACQGLSYSSSEGIAVGGF